MSRIGRKGGSWLTVLLGLGLGLACDHAQPPVTVAPAATNDSTVTATEGASAWMSAQGHGATEAEAALDAQQQLAARLLGDTEWLTLFPLQVHDATLDVGPIVSRTETGVTVALGLSRARAASVISELETRRPEIRGPKAWHDTLYAYVTAHAAAHVCQRRRVLFEASCEAQDIAEAEAEVRQLAASVNLVSEYRDGIPVDAQGQALRVPSIFVLWNGVPVEGVPVVVVEQGAQTRRSDAAGRVNLTLTAGAKPSAPIRVSVDARALLGPLSSTWMPSELRLESRPLALSRWALLSSDRDGADLEPVKAALVAAGLTEPSTASEALSRAAGRPGAFADAAHRARGAFDFVVVAKIRSAFASRMGGNRVWFEAEGSLEVVQAWSGETVSKVEAKERASGVGDARAEAAVREKLLSALVSSLKRSPDVIWPAPS